MKTLFTAEVTSQGGRNGTIHAADGHLAMTLGNPLDKTIADRGPNPETFFAAAYAACYNGALGNAAKKQGVDAKGSTVRALVSLVEDDKGGYSLAVILNAHIPGVEHEQAQRIMEAAHQTCPYSKALRGDAKVSLVVE